MGLLSGSDAVHAGRTRSLDYSGSLLPDDGAWHQVVAHRHGTMVTDYTDGVLVRSQNCPDPSPFNVANGNPLIHGGPGSGAQVAIDPLRIFTRALTDDEIQR